MTHWPFRDWPAINGALFALACMIGVVLIVWAVVLIVVYAGKVL